MIETGCREKILSKINSLTNTEKKIAQYVLDHYESVLNSNIIELSEQAKVSEASVVRFCKSLGYKGFQEFKIKAAIDVLPKDKHFNPVLKEDDSVEGICRKIFNSEMSVLNRTLLGLDMKAIEAAAEAIYSAKQVVLFGSGGSQLVAQDALHKLMKIGIKIHVYADHDLQLMSSSLMKPEDVAIGISHSGSNSSVYYCLKNARECGAKTIALVRQGKTPLSKNADIILQTTSEETIFQSESVTTRIAQLAIIDSLVAVVAFKNYDDSYAAIQQTRSATSINKI